MQNNRNSKESPNYPLASNLSKKETTKTIKSTTKRKSKDADKKRKRKEDMRRSITKKNRKKTKIHLTIKILGIKSSPSKSLNSKNLSQKKPLLLIQYTMQTKLIEIPVWLTIQAKADNMKSPGWKIPKKRIKEKIKRKRKNLFLNFAIPTEMDRIPIWSKPYKEKLLNLVPILPLMTSPS